VLAFVSLNTTPPAEGIMKRSRTFRRVVLAVLAILGVAMIPTFAFAQPSDPNATAVSIPGAAVALRPATVGRIRLLAVSNEQVSAGGPPRPTAPRDSLRNGALIGAAVGAAVLGGLAATICHVHRERGGPSCVPDSLRFAAIGGAIGLGAGVVIDVALSSGPMARVTIVF
jgi:hypothetical protein